MNYFCVALFWACAFFLQSVSSEKTPCSANEEYSNCGNLCENSCDNNCDESEFLSFYDFQHLSTCQPGCYCMPGYVRDTNGDCVEHTPSTCGCGCGKNRCGSLTDNAIYDRCNLHPEKACFERSIAVKLSGFKGRCTCMPGYKMNSDNKCVLETSPDCLAEAGTVVNNLWLPDSSC